tara:strand:- start:235 stop:1335 length:1101 start_codon:yes stop_codon:yes gene_type:complete
MGDFNKLGLKKQILQAIKHKESTEVQEKIIPLALQGKNIVFTSMTGSGKTLAYTLGFLGKINPKLGIQMIVLVPTRELAIQVKKEIEQICEPLKIKVGMLFGGRSIAGDYKTTKRRNQILIGTPGRLIQHVNEKNIKIGDVKYLVFDESDQMFDRGFADDCAYLITRTSKQVQIILSSATISEKVQTFIDQEINDYQLLNIGIKIPKKITQEKTYCDIKGKNKILLNFFSDREFKRALIFCNTKAKTETISDFLRDHNYKAQALNGQLEQQDRQNRLNLFKDGKLSILVTTDLAARGLHVPKIDLIINYDVPVRDDFYVHRIGRTGRNNNAGYALTLICPEDEERFLRIETTYQLEIKNAKFLETG